MGVVLVKLALRSCHALNQNKASVLANFTTTRGKLNGLIDLVLGICRTNVMLQDARTPYSTCRVSAAAAAGRCCC